MARRARRACTSLSTRRVASCSSTNCSRNPRVSSSSAPVWTPAGSLGPTRSHGSLPSPSPTQCEQSPRRACDLRSSEGCLARQSKATLPACRRRLRRAPPWTRSTKTATLRCYVHPWAGAQRWWWHCCAQARRSTHATGMATSRCTTPRWPVRRRHSRRSLRAARPLMRATATVPLHSFWPLSEGMGTRS